MLLDVPGWVVQRLWLALVMCGGVPRRRARLARALGVRSDLACILAGFAFALSPRMLTTLGPISIEAWPSALAPWVLLPLVLGARRAAPRAGAAALSALAVAMVGGVNAAATFAVLPLGVVGCSPARPGPDGAALMLWWPVFTAARHAVVAGARCSCWAPTARRSSTSSRPRDHDVPDHPVRRAARHVELGAVRRHQLAGRQRPDPQAYLVLNSGVLLLLGLRRAC